MALREPRRRERRGGELEVEIVRLEDITPHPKNAREHSERNIQVIARSLDRYGQRTPLVVGRQTDDEGRPYILKGNGTYEALKRLGASEVAITRVNHLMPLEEDAYAIADNQASDTSDFNVDTLGASLRELEGAGIDLADTGFNAFEIEPLIELDDEPPEEEPPEEEPSVRGSGYSYVPLLFDDEDDAAKVKAWFKDVVGFEGSNGLARGRAFIKWLGGGKKPQPTRRR